jgi:hypothetical protein
MIAAINLSGCGGSSSPVSVAVTASAATVDATDAVTLTATVTNDRTPGGVTWSVSGGGALSGQTTTSATYTAPAATSSAQTVTVTATSVADTTKIGTTTITVPAALAVTTTSINLAGNVGTAYSVQLAGTGGISPYTWTVASGSTLPAGLILSTAGVISGTPLAAGAGTTNVAFVMKDSGTATPLSVTQTLGVTIIGAPAIAFTGTMPATATYNAAYTGSAAASGGVGTLTYSLASGSLPTGLNPINSSTGAITGTPTAVGTYNFTIKAADAFGDSNTQGYTITVSPAVPTLTFAAIPTETYGNAPFTVSASSASSGTITYSVTSGPATINSSTGSVTITGAGQVVLGASQVASGNYAAAIGSATFTVGKATATIIVTPYSLTYDANAHTATATATGLSGVNLIADLTLSGTTHTSAGTYASDAWSFTDPTGNYASASGTVSDTISKATATINVTPYSLTYDANAHTATATATGVGGANLIADLTLSGTTHTSAGTYASDGWSFTDPNGNYASASGTVSDLISKATAIVNVTPYSVTYDGNAHTATATATGVGGATLSATDFTLTSTTHTNAGTYANDAWSFTDPNYSSASGTVSDAISVATAIVNVTPYNVTYDGNPHTASATATGAGGANLIADLTLSGTTHTSVGTYASDAWSFADPNYVSQSGTVSDTISKATATINVMPYSVTYDGNPHTATATATGAGGVTLSATDFTLTGTTHTNAGPYAGDAWSFTDPSGNYANASGTVNDKINQATAAIIVSPYTVIYDGNPHTATGTATGVGGANLNADLTLNGTTHTDAGSYPSDAWSFTDATGNYANANGTVSDQISAETVSLSFASIPTHTYGDAPFTVSATSISGGAVTYSVTSGPATVDATTGLVTLTSPGAVPAIVVLSASQAASGNYAVSTTSTSFTVDPALSITTASPLPNGVVGSTYSQTLTAIGGTGTYSWSVPSSTDQTCLTGLGLSLSTGGVLSSSGATLLSGNVGSCTSFSVQINDNASPNHTASKSFSVTVSNFAITTSSLPAAYTGTAYSKPLTVVGGGGSDTYQWTVSINSTGFAALGLSINSSNGTISGTAVGLVAGSATFTVKVVDTTTTAFTTQQYTLNVYNPLSLTTPSTTVPGPAVIGQFYTGNNIFASGGSGSYSWAVTGLTSGLTYNTTGNPLVISGTPPTTSQTINASVTLTDTSTSKTYGPIMYNIVVAPKTPLTLPAANPNPLPSGTINESLYTGYINASGGSGSGYVWSINGSQVLTNGTAFALTDGLSAYNTGDNTLSINGNLGSTPQTITLTNVTVTDSANDNAGPVTYTITVINPAAGYTVSGSVIYSGSLTGWVYLQLVPTNCNGGCDGNLGTAINASTAGSLASPGMAFTINGVPTGTYTLQAWMDNTSTDAQTGEVMGGYGGKNASNPTGVGGSNVIVTSGPVTTANVTLLAPTGVTLGSNTPTWDPSKGFGTFNGGAFITYDPITNSNGIEIPNSYEVQYNTSSSFTGTGGDQCFPATGAQQPWIVTGISGSGPYYFRAAGVIGSCFSGTIGTYSAATSSAYTIANPSSSSGNLVQGTVTFSPAATGPLYVGFYDQSTGNIYVAMEGSEAIPPISGVGYSLYIPSGSNYYNFGLVDQKNQGLFVPGTIANVNEQLSQTTNIVSGTNNVGNLALPSANSMAVVKTQSNQNTDINGNTGTGYSLNLRVFGLYKQPASVELYSGPSYLTPPLFDIATGEFNGNYDEWDYYPSTNGSTPSTSDVFTFNVTYTDGTSNSTLNSTPNPITASPTGVLTAWTTSMSPTWNTTGVSTTPTFSWVDPIPASSYQYQFQLWDNSGKTIWQIDGKKVGQNGFSNSITSLTWGVDPTGGGNTPSVQNLNPSSTYTWQIQVYDANGNEAATQVSFQTAESTLSLPDNSNPWSALVNNPYSQSLNASGGSGSGYVFTVNSITVPTTNTAVSLGVDGLYATNSGGNTLFITGIPTTIESVTLAVSVTDSQSHTAGPVTYTINVINGPNHQHDSYLNGTYVCKVDGYYDTDGSRWTSLASIPASGNAGTFTGGIFDTNSRHDTTAASGTMSGTYNIGADNNGLMTLNSVLTSGGTGSQTTQWAIALNNLAGPTASEFRMVETDDVGSNPPGQHATGDCYLATPSAFADGTISGKSFAFGLQGENGSGVPKADVARFTAGTSSASGGTGGAAGGTISTGFMDGMRVDQTGDKGGAFTGSYTVPNSNGRFTLTIIPTGGGGSAVFAAYIIDANRMFLLEIAGDSGVQSGDMRTQLQTSNTAATLISGAFVLYMQSYRYSNGSVSGYDSEVYQGTGNGAGGGTINQSYMDDNGTYSVGSAIGGPITFTFDSSYPGRVTFAPGGSDSAYLYFFDNGTAFELDLNGSGYLQTGWVEPQTQTTFTDVAVAGNYLFGEMPPPMQATQHGNVGEFNFSSSGAITSGITEAGQGDFSYDQSKSMGTLSWDSTAPGTGTFLIGSGSKGISCAVISATKIVCTFNADSSPGVMILQQ